MRYTKIAEDLGQTGLSVSPLFLWGNPLRDVRADFDRQMVEGKGAIDWNSPNEVQKALQSELKLLKDAFNETLSLGLTGLEGQYEQYAEGGFYERTRPVPQADESRVVSFVLYLNLDWIPADGGKTRVHLNGSHTDIAPIGGTLVCFRNDRSQQEVLLSHADRNSFAGWFGRN